MAERIFERRVSLVLENGSVRTYFLPHPPVNRQNGSTLVLIWEDETEVMNLAINTEEIVALEMTSTREEQPQEVLDLLDRAKAGDSLPEDEE